MAKKIEWLFKLCGIFHIRNDPDGEVELDKDSNQEFVAHIIAKLDSDSYENIIEKINATLIAMKIYLKKSMRTV